MGDASEKIGYTSAALQREIRQDGRDHSLQGESHPDK
jgi:hypothetical protein